MKNTTKTKLWAAGWIILGLVFLVLPFILDYILDSIGHPELSNNIIILLINNIFPALATIAFLSGAWEMLSKRSFAKEVLELSKVSDNYINSGIIHVYKDFTEIDWKELFRDSKKVTCFFTYAYSWRSNNRAALDMLKKQKTDVTIVLPDYNNNEIVDALNNDFKYAKYAEPNSENASKDVKNLIKEAEEFFIDFGATVKLYDGNIKSTYYLVDDMCVFAPFKHSNKKSSVPAILCKESGSLFEFCERDMASIIEVSH